MVYMVYMVYMVLKPPTTPDINPVRTESKPPQTQQLVVETSRDDSSRPTILIAFRLSITAVIHTLVFFELCQHLNGPVALSICLDTHDSSTGMHATCQNCISVFLLISLFFSLLQHDIRGEGEGNKLTIWSGDPAAIISTAKPLLLSSLQREFVFCRSEEREGL
jgi:hypothetical protein